VRYDGIYRIEKCWRHKGTQGQLMCRYLFVRCDNEPAPWTADGATAQRSFHRARGLSRGAPGAQKLATARDRCRTCRS
jgi:hypothetical protein